MSNIKLLAALCLAGGVAAALPVTPNLGLAKRAGSSLAGLNPGSRIDKSMSDALEKQKRLENEFKQAGKQTKEVWGQAGEQTMSDWDAAGLDTRKNWDNAGHSTLNALDIAGLNVLDRRHDPEIQKKWLKRLEAEKRVPASRLNKID